MTSDQSDDPSKKLGFEILERRDLLSISLIVDANNDGLVNIFDTNQVASDWGETAEPVVAAADHPHPDDPIKEAEHLAVMALLSAADANGTTKIFVPAGDTLTHNIGTFVCDWILVEGTLRITSGTLRVGTIVVAPTGRLEFTGGVVEFYGETVDPFAFGIGLISHGAASIVGATQTSHTVAAAFSLSAGQASIEVADAAGWNVGDKLVIAGTSLDYRVNQDDVRTITAVSGKSITLNTPLAFAHTLVDGHLPVIINLTRSVTFRTAAGSPDRGHVMLMHNGNIEVKYAAFEGLGRTDKSRPISTPDGLGGGLDNPLGRYSLHFHRTGYNWNSTQIPVTGVAIDGSPGWGIVNHDSYVNVLDSVVYNAVGASFVQETALARGTFTRNVAVRGVGGRATPTHHDMAQEADFARDGIGFWTDGGFISIVDCISIGQNGGGIFVDGERQGLAPQSLSPAESDDLAAKSWWYAKYRVNLREVPFVTNSIPVKITGNFVYGSQIPLVLWRLGTDIVTAQSSDYGQVVGNTFIQGETKEAGVVLGYCGRLEFRNNRILGNGSWTGTAVGHTGDSMAMRYIDNTVVGFITGLKMPSFDVPHAVTKEPVGSVVEGGYYDNSDTNLLILNTRKDHVRKIVITNPTFGDRAKWNVQMQASYTTFNLELFYGPKPTNKSIDLLFGPVGLGAKGSVLFNGVPLFFEEQGAAFKFGERLVNAPADLRTNPDGSFTTTADLAARGKIVGGVPLPAGTQSYLPNIRGVFVGA